MSLTTGFATLAMETLAVLAAVGVSWFFLSVYGLSPARVAVAVVAALATALALSTVQPAVSSLTAERKSAVGAQAGIEHCLYETGAAGSVAFLRWLKTRMPSDARYWLADAPELQGDAPGLDPLCVALELLPRLPETVRAHAGWVVGLAGTVPADVQRRIALRDPTVQVFAPGYVLAREGTR